MKEAYRLTATAAVDLLRKREVSPLELVEAAAGRIAQTEPALNAMPTLCLERARGQAKRLMQNPPRDPPAHFLYGLPIAVKDNVDVQGVRCTFGSPIFADRISPASDVVVQRLEAAGALVIGKTNIPEFAAGGNTFNDVFGVTRNPWNTSVTPGGSSGGTAAALAAGQVWLGTGNDFGGSIRTPASFCSLVGLRPTAGLVPRIQKQPYSPLNVEGPMARNVADCALMLECEAGHHPQDPLSVSVVPGTFSRAAASPRRPGVVALSLDLGVAPVVMPEVARLFRTLGEKLAGAGCAVDEAWPVRSESGRASSRAASLRAVSSSTTSQAFTRSSVALSGSVISGRRRLRAGSGAPPAPRPAQIEHSGAAGSHPNGQPATTSMSPSSSSSPRTAVDFAVPVGPLTSSPPTAGFTALTRSARLRRSWPTIAVNGKRCTRSGPAAVRRSARPARSAGTARCR